MLNPLRSVSRRTFLRSAVSGGATAGLHLVGLAQPGGGPRSETGAEFITAETQEAIDRGLAQLAHGQASDGSFGGGLLAGGVAAGITGLCGLALLGAGQQPGRGKYAKHISRVVDYVVDRTKGASSGFLTTDDFRFGSQPSAMYSHGFASLFLAEVCGMLPEAARQKKVRAVLERATAFAVDAQNKEGGWRYEPKAPFADVSVTVAFMMALRAARNAGVFVRKSVIRQGSEYIRRCQLPDGGFSYFKGQGGSAFARTAAAVVGLYSASVPEDEEVNSRAIERGLRYLQQYMPNRMFNQRELPAAHYYYGQYYAALAMWTAGGDYWRTWFPAIRDELLGRVRASGGTWADHVHGPAYATAMSLIVLQLPNNYLPILQK
ncbi:prenyltransferase [Gemmata sp. JC717]|uniref:Prenyltransferase n=1 Tax=Gemmata algarum TaxID=2975278 RepID=A0ABU5F2X4_9BACT|nr:prenyltransferase [Gemmata algarum]MDY3551803.1 prenyltransferase [Gemmata algarum]MDY3560219.1 prenyltransferase [Gemmata algarum]